MEVKAWDIVSLVISLMAQAAFILITYKFAIKQFRMSKASNYLERFMSKEMMDARATVDKYCNRAECSVDEMVRKLKDDQHKEDLNQVRMFANFFQEIGIAYRKGLVDRIYTEEIFDFLTKAYWQKLNPWVQDYRARAGDASLYSKWEDIAIKFLNTKD